MSDAASTIRLPVNIESGVFVAWIKIFRASRSKNERTGVYEQPLQDVGMTPQLHAAHPACPSRIRCQAATGSWTKSRQWEI